jgi:hypothetical protein
MKYFLQKFLVLFIATSVMNFALFLNNSYSQELVDDILAPVSVGDSNEMFTEVIRIISKSKRVFIITNTNQMLNKGDFITLVLNQRDPVARAVVGKNHEGLVGIKILKIYSLKRWAMIRRGMDIKILKGDDSFLFKKVEKKTKDDMADAKIGSEEDLYNTTMLDEDLNMFGKDNRLIKPDNIIAAHYSRYMTANDLSGDTEAYNEFGGSWSYQFSDNLWVEGLYGRILMSGIPAEQTQTVINNITIRVKYTFQAPLYSYILPYVGYQMHSVSSPDAGNVDNAAQAEAETAYIQKLQKRQFVAGITILRRMVPGWFLKADLGNDHLNIGFAVEF